MKFKKIKKIDSNEWKIAKNQIQNIQFSSDHGIIRNKWQIIKSVLDEIYKKSLCNDENDHISLNPNIFSQEQREFLEFVLKKLLKAGIFDYYEQKNQIVRSSLPFRKFLSGELIIIKDRLAFEEYRNQVNKLLFFIEKDGEKRFPEAYKQIQESKTFYNEQTTLINSQKKTIVSIKLPSWTKWEDITMKFIDGHTVKIFGRKINYTKNYKDMGLDDERKHNPNAQWGFLIRLAENNGELAWADPGAIHKYKKIKQLLSNALKIFFQKDEDPFYPYKKLKAYKIKIQLVPESNQQLTSKSRKDIQKTQTNDRGLEITRYYNEQTPHVYKKDSG